MLPIWITLVAAHFSVVRAQDIDELDMRWHNHEEEVADDQWSIVPGAHKRLSAIEQRARSYVHDAIVDTELESIRHELHMIGSFARHADLDTRARMELIEAGCGNSPDVACARVLVRLRGSIKESRLQALADGISRALANVRRSSRWGRLVVRQTDAVMDIVTHYSVSIQQGVGDELVASRSIRSSALGAIRGTDIGSPWYNHDRFRDEVVRRELDRAVFRALERR